MTGFGLNADQGGGVACLRRLECSSKFEGVPWHNAVIVVGGGDKRGRILGAGFDIVERGISQQGFELFWIV